MFDIRRYKRETSAFPNQLFNSRSSEKLNINLKLKMLKALFSIWFFIFCLPNSSCLFNDTIGAGELLNRVVEQLNGIPPPRARPSCGVAYPGAIQRLREFRDDFQKLYHYVIPSYGPPDTSIADGKYGTRLHLEGLKMALLRFTTHRSFFDFLHYFEEDELPFYMKHSLKRFPLISERDLGALRSLITPLKAINLFNDGYFHSIATWGRKYTQCDVDHTVQSFLIESYKNVILSEIKVHMILALSYAYQHGPLMSSDSENGDIDERRRYLTNYLSEQLLAYSMALSSSLKAIGPLYFRYCDPSSNSWIQDVSSFELNGFLKEVIFRYETPFCTASCSAIWHENACRREWIDKRTACDGRVTSCAWLGDVKGCALASGPRKYQWVQSSELGILGNNSASCPEGLGYHIGTEQRVAYEPERGCNCDCLEYQWKVYLGPFESRESDNYVITGVRFRLKDDMLFLQPAQGKLHHNGYIADYEWIDLPEVIPKRHIAKIDLNHRSFFLDDLQLGPGHALTGIRFRAVQRGGNTTIRGFDILISGRPVDYRTGILDLAPENKSIDAASGSGIERELIYRRVRPIDTEIFKRLEPSPQNFTYLTLKQSELTDDFGQSTLPLFDSTPVVMSAHSPLSGISIFHKGAKDNSGFISVKVRQMSYLPSIRKLIKMYAENAQIE